LSPGTPSLCAQGRLIFESLQNQQCLDAHSGSFYVVLSYNLMLNARKTSYASRRLKENVYVPYTETSMKPVPLWK